MNYLKFLLGIALLVAVFFLYRDVRKKKMLRMGDHEFFTENPNRVSISELFSSWRLIIWFTIGALMLIFSALGC